jgi:hypothetical protein
MIPLVCHIHVHRRDGRCRRIWIPLILLWPFIIALFAVAELFVILACVVLLFIWPRDAVKLALALPAALYLLFQIAGMSLEFAGPGQRKVLVQLS